MDKKYSGLHPYSGNIAPANKAATKYPTEYPACNVPKIVVRFFVGTYSAISIVTIEYSAPIPIAEIKRIMINCS